MQKLKCPACETEDIYLGYDKFIQTECSKCKHIYNYYKGEPVGKIFSLYIKIKFWLKSNWTKILTKTGDKIISERTIYTSRCWKCKTPIKAIVSGSTLNKRIGNYLYGNKKCQKPDCNYFICTNCNSCICDGPYAYMKGQKPTGRLWIETEL